MILAGLGVSLFAVGMWRVDGVMASMGLAIAVLFAVVWIWGRMNLSPLGLCYDGPTRVDSGKGFSGKLTLANRGRFSDCFRIAFGVKLMGESEIRGKALWLGGGGSAGIDGRVVLNTRGLRMNHGGWVRSGFPLGLMNFSKRLTVTAEIGVLPRAVVPRELRLSGFLLDGAPLGSWRNAGGVGEWKGLRERRGGDSVRRTAWAASLRSEAAGGTMLVREDEPPGSQPECALVVFHSHGGDGNLIRPDRFEKALSLLCGVLGKFLECGMPARLLADFDGWEETELKTRRQLAGLRERLMVASRAPGTEAHDLVGALGNAGRQECVVVISDMPPAAWEGFVPECALDPVLPDITDYDGSRKLIGRRGGRR